MNQSDVKIRKISLSNFRGAKDLIDLDFSTDNKSCAIFGNNAEGKSTFTQAFEWFFTGRIASLKGEGISEDDIVNLSSGDDDETSVNIVFNEPALNSSKIYEKITGRPRFSNKSIGFSSYIENRARYDRLYLDQNTIIWFLTRTKGEKKAEIAKIVGFEEIVKVKSIISSVLNNFERSPELKMARRNLADNQGLMTKNIYGEPINDIPGLLKKSQEFLNVFGIKEKQTSIEQLEATIEIVFTLLPSQERAEKRFKLEAIKERIEKIEAMELPSSSLSPWISSFNDLVKDKANVSRLKMDNFLRQAEIVLQDYADLTTCLLCEQEIESQEILLKSVIDRYRKLEEIRKRLNMLSTEFTEIETVWTSFIKDTTTVLQDLERNEIPHDNNKIQSGLESVRHIVAHVNDQFSNQVVIQSDLSTTDDSVKELIETILDVKVKLEAQISSLALSKEEKDKQMVYKKLIQGKDLFLENIGYKKKMDAFNLTIKNLHYIEDKLLDCQNSVMQQVMDAISEDVNKFFCYLNRKENIHNLRLNLKGDEGIEFSLNFYDYETSPPKKFLSESQLNSVGIAFFLAAVRKFNKANKFFILDDVLVSFDKNYRLRLLELLEEFFSDYQIILMTHEEYWYHMIKRKFPDWILKEVSWDFSTGIRFKDADIDYLQYLRQKLESGEKVGNDLRIYTEALLKDICLALKVKLAFRQGIENERRMIGELLPALTSTLKKHRSDFTSLKEYKDLEVSSFILSCSSHDNPDLDSVGDISEAIDIVERFRSQFLCSHKRYIERDNIVPGMKKISCKCGCLQTTWN